MVYYVCTSLYKGDSARFKKLKLSFRVFSVTEVYRGLLSFREIQRNLAKFRVIQKVPEVSERFREFETQ